MDRRTPVILLRGGIASFVLVPRAFEFSPLGRKRISGFVIHSGPPFPLKSVSIFFVRRSPSCGADANQLSS